MTPERWRQTNNLLQEALDRSFAERGAFLDDVCSKDETLRKEVESLISFHERAQDFLETPALETAASLFADDGTASLVGQLIGSYKIEKLIGTGGMGEVYLAEDTSLDRKVAIKFLPIDLEADELARRRQIREAKAAAKLDHPNICAIHEVAEEASRSFIVMQYVDGETLASRMERRAMELRESLDLVIQIADALSLAHSHGVIHRDIKPQNIMITPRDQVKVLDFGLAKVVRRDGVGEDVISRETPLSAPGVILGTVPYMSPEQAKGAAVDARSDLFSLGVLLYECVAGKPAFAGDTPMEICAQVIHVDPPPPSQLNPNIPPQLDRVILKMLAKEPGSRYQSAGDLVEDLRAARGALKAEDNERTRPIGFGHAEKAGVLASVINMARRPRVLAPALIVALAVLSVPVWWRAAPHRPSPEASYWCDQGTAALYDGTYYKASKALGQAIQLDDKFALAHARLAEAWTELDYTDKANYEILRARSLVRDLSPLPPLEALYLETTTHVVLREFGPAIQGYRKITEQVPDIQKSNAYVDLGRAYEKNEEIDKAIESYLEAIRLAPTDAAAFLRIGILYGRQQNLERAREAFQKAEVLYQALSNHEGVTEVLYQRGFLFYNLNKLPEARTQLEKALELTTAIANEYQQIKALLVLSNVSAVEGHTIQAEQQATKAIELARANGIENQATGGLIWLGNSFLMRGEYGDAERYYKQALELAQKDGGRLNEAWAQMSLGSLRTLQRNTDEGVHYLNQALFFYRQGGYGKWLSLTLTLLGRAYRDKGDYEAAVRAFKDQLELGEQAGDLSQVAIADEEIGSVFSVQQQYPEALRHFDKSYEINKSLNAPLYVGYNLMHRGSVLWQLGRYQEARAALDEASAIAERPEGSYKQLLASIHLIDALMELSEWSFPESKVKSRQALSLAGTQYKTTAIQAKYALGLAQTRSGVRSGRLFCEEAVDMATSTGDPQLLSGALLAYAEAMLENGDARRALEAALRAQESFARFGQQDSEWRAWLIAARAKWQLGEEAAREYASNANARLTSLEQKWGMEAFNGYLARPDIQHFRAQLDQLLRP